jgi:hypothetical protein
VFPFPVRHGWRCVAVSAGGGRSRRRVTHAFAGRRRGRDRREVAIAGDWHAESRHAVAQRAATEAEQPGGAHDIASGAREHLPDALRRVGHRIHWRRRRQGDAAGLLGRRQAIAIQDRGLDHHLGMEQREALQQVAELPHVTGPGLLAQPTLRRRRQLLRRKPVGLAVLVEELPREQHDVIAALSERRHLEHDDRQPVVEVRTESPLGDPHVQIDLGRRDQLDVDLDVPHRTQPSGALVLDDLEELALQRQRQGFDFVEEECPAGGDLEEAGLGMPGVGEGAGLEAQELGLQEGVRDRGS